VHPPLQEPPNLKSVTRIDKWLPIYLRQNGLSLRSLSLSLLEAAIRRKNVHWPLLIARYLRGKDVLDVGCGRSLYGVTFLFAGAKSYTGVDPTLDLDSNVIKDSSGLHGRFEASPWTPRRLMDRLPGLAYISGLTSDLPPGSTFDVLAMHNVTEHLMEIDQTFAEFAKLIRPGGRIVFRHPNYYSWGGHHLHPRTLDEIIDDDPRQTPYMDWEHLRDRPDWPEKIALKQNRIRLGDLRELVARHFDIELWQSERSSKIEGAERLTPEILASHPDFTEEEMLTQAILCVARKPTGHALEHWEHEAIGSMKQ
jgi:SAM-dependent methyltransferase